MSFFKDAFKKQTAFEVVGGKNLLKKSMANIYKMVSMEKEHGEGIVKIKGNLYYFLGAHKEESHSRSAGKAAAGAILGSVLGGAGSIVGAAIGGKKKDTSIFYLDLMDYETKQEFTIQAIQAKGHFHSVNEFRIANIPLDQKTESPSSTADEIRKFKELLDDGIITEDEFEVKRKELLGI